MDRSALGDQYSSENRQQYNISFYHWPQDIRAEEDSLVSSVPGQA